MGGNRAGEFSPALSLCSFFPHSFSFPFPSIPPFLHSPIPLHSPFPFILSLSKDDRAFPAVLTPANPPAPNCGRPPAGICLNSPSPTDDTCRL